MIPSALMLSKIGLAIAAQADTIAPAEDECLVQLISGNTVLDNTTVLGSLTLISTNGLGPITGVAGVQLESRDPANGDVLVEIKMPVGGWRFETTSAPTTPIIATGIVLLNNAGTVYIAGEMLETPITFAITNQSYTHPKLIFRIPVASIR